MINVADPDTKKYYVSKQIELIKTKSLNQLSESDIAILNLPGMAKLKEEMKKKFATDFVSSGGKNDKSVQIKIPAQKEGKFIALYGFDELIKNLPSDIRFFEIICVENGYEQYALPTEFCNKFTDIETLVLENIVSSIPDNIDNLKSLTVLNLKGNKKLLTLPDSILTMNNLDMVILRNASNGFTPPKDFDKYFSEMGDNFYFRDKIYGQPEENKQEPEGM